MLKPIIRIVNWLRWHGYINAVTTIKDFVDHFNLSPEANDFLVQCTSLHLLQEFVHVNYDGTISIVVQPRDCIRLLRQRQKVTHKR